MSRTGYDVDYDEGGAQQHQRQADVDMNTELVDILSRLQRGCWLVEEEKTSFHTNTKFDDYYYYIWESFHLMASWNHHPPHPNPPQLSLHYCCCYFASLHHVEQHVLPEGWKAASKWRFSTGWVAISYVHNTCVLATIHRPHRGAQLERTVIIGIFDRIKVENYSHLLCGNGRIAGIAERIRGGSLRRCWLDG